MYTVHFCSSSNKDVHSSRACAKVFGPFVILCAPYTQISDLHKLLTTPTPTKTFLEPPLIM